MEEIVFPNQIRMMRRVSGKSMQQVADLLGLSISAVSKIEKGYRRLNERQLQTVATFLDCPVASLFVDDQAAGPEVIQAWKEEQKRRRQMNVGGGLKVLGAALRYLRGQKKITLTALAEGAHLTLSVYHRIEMGQREVDEITFAAISRALGMSAEDLQLKIYELDMSGVLEDLKNSESQTGVNLFKGGYNDLPISRLMLRRAEDHEVTVPIEAVPGIDGKIYHDKAHSMGAVVCPSTLANDVGLYAVRLGSKENFAGVLPASAVLVISPTMALRSGDLAAWHVADNEIKIISVKKDELNRWYGFNFDSHEWFDIQNELSHIQRVVWIALL